MRHRRTTIMAVILGLALLPVVCVALPEVEQTEINWMVQSSRHTTWIDELPQLFKVLLGDMSFVGPRPERTHFVSQL